MGVEDFINEGVEREAKLRQALDSSSFKYKDWFDRIASGTNPFQSQVSQVEGPRWEQELESALKEQGFDLNDPEVYNELANLVGDSRENEGWLDTDDYRYDDLTKYLDKKSRAISKATRDASEKSDEEQLKELEKEAQKVYPEREKALEGITDQFGKDKADLVKQFGVQDDLLDNLVEQAQEYSTSPSVVDSQLNDVMTQNLRNQIQGRLASRKRYGGLEQAPGRSIGDDASAFARQAATGRLREDQSKQSVLMQALKSRISGKGNNLAQKGNFLLGGVGREQALNNALTKLKLNKPTYMTGLQSMLDKELQRGRLYDDHRAWQGREPHRRLERQGYANSQRWLAAGKGIAGAGLAYFGGPAGAKAGAQLGVSGWNDWQAANVNSRESDRRTPGYYGLSGFGSQPHLEGGSPTMPTNKFSDDFYDNAYKGGKEVYKKGKGFFEGLF